MAIIAILVSLLIPALSKARSAAKYALCKNGLKQIGVIETTYAADNKGAYLYKTNVYLQTVYSTAYGGGSDGPDIRDDLLNYSSGNSRVFFCPVETTVRDPVYEASVTAPNNQSFAVYSGNIYRITYTLLAGYVRSPISNDWRQSNNVTAYTFPTRVDKTSPTSELAADWLESWPNIPNSGTTTTAYRQNHYQKDANVLYANGSVAFNPTPRLQLIRSAGVNTFYNFW